MIKNMPGRPLDRRLSSARLIFGKTRPDLDQIDDSKH